MKKIVLTLMVCFFVGININVYSQNSDSRREAKPFMGVGPVDPSVYHPWITYNWGADWRPVGFRYSTLPEYAVPVKLTDKQYKQSDLPDLPLYFANNSFYMLKNGFYKIVPAPIGYVWRALPLGTEKIEYNKETYYFYGGVFLQEKNNVYVTVKAPEGAIIIKMPQGARPVTMHGATFYIYGNDYYLPVFLDDKPAYEVAKDPKLVF